MEIHASPLLLFGFMALTLIVLVAWLAGLWTAARLTGAGEAQATRWLFKAGLLSIGWLLFTLLLAASGVLLHFTWVPPPMIVLLVASLALGAWVGGSRLGARLAALPVAALVGFEAFRWPLELLIHRGYMQGFVPRQMTYVGRNFDIVTGITAAVLALGLARWRVPALLVSAWNVLGLALLANILIIAVLSMPTFRAFGPDQMNVWVAMPPFVWLPAVLVAAALAGHIVIVRKLRTPGSR